MMKAKAVQLAGAAREASFLLSRAGTAAKNGALLNTSEKIDAKRKTIKAANAKDLKAGKKDGLSAAMLDRLELNDKRIDGLCEGLEQVIALTDPVGETITGWTRPNGLNIRKVRIPIGVVFMIYESRPNVTIDAGALCLKSGNACILRGGKEALYSNLCLGGILREGLASVGLPGECVQVVDTPDRELARELLHCDSYIDVVIPRGGKGLNSMVKTESSIPVIMHLDGICHVFIDAECDLDMAVRIAINAKTHRTGVCNAMETLLVHTKVAKKFLPIAMKAFRDKGCELRGCKKTLSLCKGIKMQPATEEDWATEYLDLILSVKVVSTLDEAIRHVNTFGSGHTDSIVTSNLDAAERFRREVNSSSVMVNASTRFSDGFEYGFGAEIGISTNKLHARGPVGLDGLTTYKYLVDGSGQIRG